MFKELNGLTVIKFKSGSFLDNVESWFEDLGDERSMFDERLLHNFQHRLYFKSSTNGIYTF